MLLPRLAAGALTALSSATASAHAAAVKVACVGEQTTHSDRLERSVEYPAKLQLELGANFEVQNFGDSRSTVLLGYPRQPETHPYLDVGSASSFTQSVAYWPDIVVIGSWGKHDTEIANSLYSGKLDPVKFQADYEQLVTTYLDLGSKPTVYVSTPVPIPKGAPQGVTTTVILPTVEKVAAKYNLPVVPLYAAFLHRPDLYKDDTHVSDDVGLQTIADTIYDALGFGGNGGSSSPGSNSGANSGSGSSPRLGDMSTNSSAGCAIAASPGEAKGTTVWALIANVGLILAWATRRRRYS